MTFIAVDLGTSFIKGAVLDLERLSLSHIRRVPFPGPVAGLPSLFYEVDPMEIVAAFRSFVAELLPHAPNCEGIVMCSQMHGLVLTDERGSPLSNCLTWQDQRALLPHPSGEGSYFEVISSRLSPADRQQLGNELKPSLPLCYLFWLAEEGKLPPGELIPSSLPDFVLAHLSGSRPGIELSNAGSHGALNLETLDWHEEVISKLRLDHLRWPDIRIFGQVAAEIEIEGQSLPCYTPVGDHQCAITGAFLDYNELSLNIATASQVTLLTPELRFGNYQTRPFFDGRFMNTIARIPAGRSLNVLVELLTELARAEGLAVQDPWASIEQAVAAMTAKNEETSLRVELSFFASSVGDRGEISNIQEDNLTVGHLFRAAFQNMADNYYACALRLSPERAWQNLVYSGGLVQKLGSLRQIIGEKFEVADRLSASLEDTLLGLLALALAASGQADSVQAATGLLLERYEE